MILASCPLRISLVGGSTDHPKFIEKYGHGAVISFASNLRTYVTIHQDIFGANAIDERFIINYSRRETVSTIPEIQNELIKHCFDHLNVTEYLNCTLTSDAFSVGSGLASSSSYLQSLIKAIFVMREQSISHPEICRLAELIEKKFNPLAGQQDFYGSLGGLKRIDFYEGELPHIRFLNNQIFKQLDCYLLYTGILRNSTDILIDVDIDKSLVLLKDVDELEHSINTNNIEVFNAIINNSWEHKKETSKNICSHPDLMKLDKSLYQDNNVLSHKLCGAGNGGFFLIFTLPNMEEHLFQRYSNINKITISEIGIDSINFKHEFTRL